MTVSTCTKCSGHSFELALFTPLGESKTLAIGPGGAFFFMFGQFAVYRARRYRLTRTIWRGLRFWMTGSGRPML